MKKDLFLVALGSVITCGAFVASPSAIADVSPINDPAPACSLPDNNACNNADGCGTAIMNPTYWVDWRGLTKEPPNSQFLPCKDLYLQVRQNGQCLQGSFYRTMKEYACST